MPFRPGGPTARTSFGAAQRRKRLPSGRRGRRSRDGALGTARMMGSQLPFVRRSIPVASRRRRRWARVTGFPLRPAGAADGRASQDSRCVPQTPQMGARHGVHTASHLRRSLARVTGFPSCPATAADERASQDSHRVPPPPQIGARHGVHTASHLRRSLARVARFKGESRIRRRSVDVTRFTWCNAVANDRRASLDSRVAPRTSQGREHRSAAVDEQRKRSLLVRSDTGDAATGPGSKGLCCPREAR
jgi:hypothetical protein